MKKSVMLLSLFFFLWLSNEVLAQCGASVSSCKNCHEVQGKMKVNSKGDWHKQHAFGDFCEFCHGGNVQSQDKSKAHEGMEAPMADVKVSCSSCHAADLMDRAQKYAAILHVDLSQPAKSTSQTKPQTVQEDEKKNETIAPAEQEKPKIESSESIYQAADNEIIDFNNLAESLDSSTEVSKTNWGNWIVFSLILIVAAVFIGLWYFFNQETVNQKINKLKTQWSSEEYQVIAEEEEPKEFEFGELNAEPNRKKLLLYIKKCDAETILSLNRVLAYGKDGEDLLKRVSQLDPSLLHSIRNLNDEQLSLLLALR